MSKFLLRHATAEDRQAIRDFLNTYWGSDHPLVNREDLFHYYYQNESDPSRIQFCLALDEKGIAALCGYILSSLQSKPDVWVSIWCARKDAKGAGLELMGKMPELTGCRTLSCNNIRENTMAFYTFLGYTALRLPHYYRLGKKERFQVARVPAPIEMPPAGGEAQLFPIRTMDELKNVYKPTDDTRPFKDLWYLHRRYLAYPVQQYDLLGAGKSASEATALLACRTVEVDGVKILRIVDYIGEPAYFPQLGGAIAQYMSDLDAEYADMYCYGIPADVMKAAGFCERLRNDPVIIPNYLNPPLYENTEYFFFTSDPENFMMCKADGDQDRPNMG